MRWLYHVSVDGRVVRGLEGYVHASFRPALQETLALYFAGRSDVRILRIDPRRVGEVRLEETPRGPMPHLYGDVPADAVVSIHAGTDIAALPEYIERPMNTVRVRFAPSPTGYLHIGGVRTALFNWLWARKTKGVFVLRIEDTDVARSTPESKQTILDSLGWLGLDWDEGPFTQTERLPLYKEYAERLIAEKKAFRCYCTKEELDAQREALKAKDPKAQFRYPGTCRDRTDQPDKPFVVRFRTPTEGALTYVDKVFGEVTTPNAAQQDFVLLRSDGVPLYNFGAVVDDVTMGITLVARGRDHRPSVRSRPSSPTCR
jgi:uncharacterized protein (DUF952 family)